MRRLRLVVTADDLGLDEPTNAVVADLLAEGRITASTLLAVAPAADDAARRLRRRGLRSPHLHATLTSPPELARYRPAAEGVPSLVDAAGTFPVDARAVRGADRREVRRELHAQLGRLRAAGLTPTAMDSHSGTLYDARVPSLTDVALDVCAAEGLAFRMPRRLHAYFQGTVTTRFHRRHETFVRRADALGIRIPAAVLTCWLPARSVVSYHQLRAMYLLQLTALPPGTSEMFLHPAPAETAALLGPAEGRKRQWELRLLRDPVFHRGLVRERVELVPSW